MEEHIEVKMETIKKIADEILFKKADVTLTVLKTRVKELKRKTDELNTCVLEDGFEDASDYVDKIEDLIHDIKYELKSNNLEDDKEF